MKERFSTDQDRAAEKGLSYRSFLCCFKSKKSLEEAENSKAFNDNDSLEDKDENEENEAFFVTKEANHEEQNSDQNQIGLLRRVNIFTAASVSNMSQEYQNSASNVNSVTSSVEQGTFFQKISRYAHIFTKRYKCFVNSPKVHFIFDAAFFTVFLIMFSYLILCKFTFYKVNTMKSEKIAESEKETIQTEISSLNQTESETGNMTHVFVSHYMKNYPHEGEISEISAFEYALFFWVISLLIEEIRQVS